jgi:hypothetical protein
MSEKADKKALAVIKRLKNIAFFNPEDFIEMGTKEIKLPDGTIKTVNAILIKRPEELTEDQKDAVRSFEERDDGSVVIEFYDKAAALESLARYFGFCPQSEEMRV